MPRHPLSPWGSDISWGCLLGLAQGGKAGPVRLPCRMALCSGRWPVTSFPVFSLRRGLWFSWWVLGAFSPRGRVLAHLSTPLIPTATSRAPVGCSCQTPPARPFLTGNGGFALSYLFRSPVSGVCLCPTSSQSAPWPHRRCASHFILKSDLTQHDLDGCA